MKNTKIINRLIDYYLEGSELTQDEHNTAGSLKEEMQAINYTRCCVKLKEKEEMTFETWLFDNFEGISINYKEKNGYKYDKNLSIIDMYKKYRSL